MKILCFPHFYYLSEVSRLIEIGKVLRNMGQEVLFFSHGGFYESIAREEGFEVISIKPTMSPDRAKQYMAYNRGETIKSIRNIQKSCFFTYEELKDYVSVEVAELNNLRPDAVLIGWNLPSYLSVQLAKIPIIVQQPGPWTAPFFDRKMAEFAPSVAGPLTGQFMAKLYHYLPMDSYINWLIPRIRLWIEPFNQLASELGLPQYKSTLDLMAGDLTLVMEHPEILGITAEELENYKPMHPEFFHKLPKYKYGGPCYAKLSAEVPERVHHHFNNSRIKLYCAMGVSGSPEVLRSIIDIVSGLDFQALIVTTNILDKYTEGSSDRILIASHVPAHLVNPMANIAITHGGAGTVQTAIHSGTPLIGIPMQIEQAGNISLVKKHDAGIMLWKQELSKKNLASSLEKISKGANFHENMKRLKHLQDQIDGASKAAREIIEYLGNN